MKKIKFPTPFVLLLFFISVHLSCSKDTDLFAEQIFLDPIVAVSEYVRPDAFQISTSDNSDEDIIEIQVSGETGTIFNDSYEISANEGIKLDVLANDQFDRPESALIVATSQPDNGTVEINSDNTLQYTPSSFESAEESFTYTVQFENQDGSTDTETATVTVNINPPFQNDGWFQVMFTEAQIDLMISRMGNGFSKPGTNGEDITRMVNEATEFLANPSVGRLDWMPSGGLSACYRGCDPVPTNIENPAHYVDDNIFYAGFYAFLLANRNDAGDLTYAQKIANAIATQTLARANDPNLDFRNRGLWVTDPAATNPFFLVTAWLERTMNNWSLIKSMDLVNGLTAAEEARIDAWFEDARDWAYDKLEAYYVAAFGSGWRTNAHSTGYNRLMPYGTSPIFAVNGVPQNDYTLNFAAVTTHANIPSKYASFLHYYGLIYQEQLSLDLSERWYKDYFKLAVFPDGTFIELMRAKSSDNELGMHYWCVTMSTLASIAHSHAVAVLQNNPIVAGYSYSEFYDYTTSEGLSDYLPSHVGSDTKGGNKGLESYLVAFSKYLGQSTGLNEWGEIRQVNATGNEPHELTIHFGYFVPIAQANAYYQNTKLQSVYSGTNGYQAIRTKAEGARYNGPYRESYMGSFGKYMIAFPYLETEGLIYN